MQASVRVVPADVSLGQSRTAKSLTGRHVGARGRLIVDSKARFACDQPSRHCHRSF